MNVLAPNPGFGLVEGAPLALVQQLIAFLLSFPKAITQDPVPPITTPRVRARMRMSSIRFQFST